jgi:hypothetical protein
MPLAGRAVANSVAEVRSADQLAPGRLTLKGENVLGSRVTGSRSPTPRTIIIVATVSLVTGLAGSLVGRMAYDVLANSDRYWGYVERLGQILQ